MSQKEMKHYTTHHINASFRVKSAGVSLVALLIVGIYYFANVLTLPSTESVPDGAFGLVFTAIVLIVVVESALQIVLFIGAGRVEDRTERDVAIATQSARNAYRVLTVGVFATIGSLFIGVNPFEMGNILLFGFLIAEIVQYGSQLMYYRRSVEH